jgi:ATP-dependent RNA helicase DDX10/DBP4
VRTKYDRMFERQNQDILADHYAKMVRNDDEDDVNLNKLDGEQVEDDALFDIKRRIPAVSDPGVHDDELGFEETGDDEVSGPKSVHLQGASNPLILDSKRREKLLKSKKKLLKLKDKGSKVVFDDDGNAHQIYELEDEEAFKARGAADDQRQKFLESEKGRVKTADEIDRSVAKEKKRSKKEKRKERERAEAEAVRVEVTDSEGEDLMANFAADAEAVSQDWGSEDEQPKSKRKKKWFEQDARKDDEGGREIATLDELEAEAAKLLG